MVEPAAKKAKPSCAKAVKPSGGINDMIRRFEDDYALEVIVDDGIEFVYPGLLGSASPVFAAMLCSDMKEKYDRSLILPGKTKEDLQLFVEFVRPLSCKKIDRNNVDRMLPWFDEYQVHKLKEDCQALLLSLPVDLDRLLQAHRFALKEQS